MCLQPWCISMYYYLHVHSLCTVGNIGEEKVDYSLGHARLFWPGDKHYADICVQEHGMFALRSTNRALRPVSKITTDFQRHKSAHFIEITDMQVRAYISLGHIYLNPHVYIMKS